MNLIGDVKGKDCIIVDDMIDTAGTLCGAASALGEKGARIVAHPVNFPNLFDGLCRCSRRDRGPVAADVPRSAPDRQDNMLALLEAFPDRPDCRADGQFRGPRRRRDNGGE